MKPAEWCYQVRILRIQRGQRLLEERVSILPCSPSQRDIMHVKTEEEAFRKRKELEQRHGDKIPRKWKLRVTYGRQQVTLIWLDL